MLSIDPDGHVQRGRRKMKLPSSISVKNILVFNILLVAFFIFAIAIITGGKNNRFSFMSRKTADVNKLNHQCKFSQKERVNWNYFYYYEDVRTKKSLVWCKVPKAASTTLTKLFLRLAGAKNTQNTTRIHKLLRDFYPRLSAKVMKHRLKTSKKFLVVRDPFERVLSAYRDKLENYERDLEYRDGYYYDHYGKFMVQPGNLTANETHHRKEPTWKEFVQYLLKTKIARFDEHWMPISRLCSPCAVGFNQIIKMDSFDSEIQNPLLHAGINISNLGWSHKTGTVANKKIINSYFKNLTLADVKKLYIKYKSDFQLFGYTPYKYFRLFTEANPAGNRINNSNKNKIKTI